MAKSTRSAIGYIRVSTVDQASSGLGLDAQRRAIKNYAELRGLALVEIIDDSAVSGGTPITKRPGGGRLVSALRRRKAAAVIMLKLDRGFRNAADCLATLGDWEAWGVTLHVTDLGGNAVNTSSAGGKFMLTVLAAAAEMERNLTSERTRAALAEAKARGVKLGSAAPGWAQRNGAARLRGARKGAEASRAVRAENARQAFADLVPLIQELRESGQGYKRIARRLNEEGYTTRRGCEWTAAAVRRVWMRAVT